MVEEGDWVVEEGGGEVEGGCEVEEGRVVE